MYKDYNIYYLVGYETFYRTNPIRFNDREMYLYYERDNGIFIIIKY